MATVEEESNKTAEKIKKYVADMKEENERKLKKQRDELIQEFEEQRRTVMEDHHKASSETGRVQEQLDLLIRNQQEADRQLQQTRQELEKERNNAVRERVERLHKEEDISTLERRVQNQIAMEGAAELKIRRLEQRLQNEISQTTDQATPVPNRPMAPARSNVGGAAGTATRAYGMVQ
jgi:hypothetical protein